MAQDVIIIGAGLYGLYAARLCARRGQRVLLLEKDGAPFSRATTVNQARLHMGYHYPRSISTALKRGVPPPPQKPTSTPARASSRNRGKCISSTS